MTNNVNWRKNSLMPVVTRKDREHRYRSCSIKKPYESEIEAELKANSLNIEHYLCKWCGNWHIGRKRKKENG